MKKRMLAILLTLCMIIALLPATVHASPDGYTFVYNFKDGFAAKSLVRETTYEKTHGFWEWHSASMATSAIGSSQFHSWGIMALSSAVGQWYALKIKVPVAGTYSGEYEYGQSVSLTGTGSVFLLPGSTENIATALSSATALCTVNYQGTVNAPSVKQNIDNISIPTAGEYLLVFRIDAKGAGFRMYSGSLTLKNGDGIVPMSAEITAPAESVTAGSTLQLAAGGYMSDRSAIDMSVASVQYESDKLSVATVDSATGLVTGVAQGKANITATVTVNSRTVSAVKEVTVTGAQLSEYSLIYDFVTDIANQTPLADIGYADTKGFWTFDSITPNETISTLRRMGYGLQMGTNTTQYVALRINVPVAGAYDTTIKYGQAAKGCVGGVYLMPASTTDIEASITNDNKIGEVDYYASSEMLGGAAYLSGLSKSVGVINIPSAGEYIVAFKYIKASENGGSSANMYPAGISFDGGDKVAVMNISNTEDSIELNAGETNQLSVTGYLSDGSAADMSELSVEYESGNDAVATVNASGLVTGVALGTTKITVTATKDALATKTVIDVRVNDSGASGYVAKYNFRNADTTDFRETTYATTNGFWKFHSVADGWETAANTFVIRSYGVQMNTGANYWAAFEINVPVAGKYNAVLEHGKAAQGGVGGMYIIPASTTDIDAALIAENKVGTVDYYASAEMLGGAAYITDSTNVGSVKFDTAGKYLVVFNYDSASPNGSTNKASYPSVLTLNGGIKPALMSVQVAVSGKIASVSGYLSDGTAANLSEARIVYSVKDASVVSIDDSGRLTTNPVGGTTTVYADVTLDGITVRGEANVTFASEEIECSETYEEYSLNTRSASFISPYASGSSARIEDIRGITYADTDGKWQWFDVGPSPFTVTSNAGMAWAYTGDSGSSRLRLQLGAGQWIALEINVPKAGRYYASLTSSKYSVSSHGAADIYIVPGTLSAADITAALTEQSIVGTVNFKDESLTDWTQVKEGLGIVDFATAGKYFLVFKQAGNTTTYLTPRLFELDGYNTLKSVDYSIEKTQLQIDETVTSSFVAKMLDGSVLKESDVRVIYTSENENVATVNNGVITAVGDGSAIISVTVMYGESSITAKKSVVVTDSSGVKSTFLDMPDFVFAGNRTILVTKAIMNSGKETTIPNSDISYVVTSGDATIKDGYIYSDKLGSIKIKASGTFKGTPFETEEMSIDIVAGSTKTEPTYYTYDMRAAAQENARKYPWAKTLVKTAVDSADVYAENVDVIYNGIFGEGIPRCRQIGSEGDPNYEYCRYCGNNVVEKYGNNGAGGYTTNIYNRPWKVQCKECRRIFPSNDFAGLYKLGLDEHGFYNVERAREKNAELVKKGEKGYLVNILYPEAATEVGDANWGVDDGFGYLTGKMNGTMPERLTYIAYYAHDFWSEMRRVIDNLSLAYVYTGDIKYGRAGAIITDRIADVFPSFTMKQYDETFFYASGGTGYGKIMGRINDCAYSTVWAQGTDAFFPALSDQAVINYLSEKSKKYNLDNDKTNAENIWLNWETGILKEIFNACKASDIFGNFGQQQYCLASAAIIMDRQPESQEMIDWIYKSGGRVRDGIYEKCTGGNLGAQFVDIVDRDGMGNESAPNYNFSWLSRLVGCADTLAKYNGDGDYDLYENPKFVRMFTSLIPLALVDTHTAQIGDTGATAGIGFIDTLSTIINGFEKLKDTSVGTQLAQYIYRRNGYKVDDLNYGIFKENPESLQQDILARLDETSYARSEMMTGYGFAILRDGVKYNSVGADTAKNSLRDFWLYFGLNGVSHAHRDALNLGIEAYGLNMAPDAGYPEVTGSDPNRLQWVRPTLSHNTVTVNEKDQATITPHGTPLHFDDTNKVKLMDIDASDAYAETSIYRRTIVMVKASDDVSYSVDFFRVLGGKTHTYSFHSQSNEIAETEGLTLVPQTDASGNYVGTYASRDSEWGVDETGTYPVGYTWLKNVRRATDGGKKFAVDFKVTDFRKAIADRTGLHLRLTMLNDFDMSEVALAGGYTLRKSTNLALPETLEYMLAKRKGTSLDSLFTAVYEPYKNTRYLSDMSSVTIEPISGTEGARDTAKAIKVVYAGSNKVDYIMYATNNKVMYKVTDGDTIINFRGFVGVYTLNANGENIYSYVNDGDTIGAVTDAKQGYSGKVIDFTRTLSLENSISVKFDDTVNPQSLIGQHVYITNDAAQNAVYRIENAEAKENGSIKLDIGTVSLIRSYRDSDDFSKGFVYNIGNSQSAYVPISNVNEPRPIFDSVSNRSVSAGSVIDISVNATSPLNHDISYKAESLPRGASLDSVTGKFRWKPDSSQVGENHIAITAADSIGLDTTIHFIVKVLGATTGGGGGGGGGGTPTEPTEPDEPTEPTEPTEPDKPDEPTEPTEPVNPPQEADGFTDLGSYAWAKDAINSLADDGIIKGVSNDKFAPGASITRADFAILLVRAFKLTAENAENFADVSPDDYFAEELAIARNTGIVGGIGDNRYAPRNKITREDMMLIVYRALTKLGITLKDSAEITGFEDADDIDGYALDAVAALITNELIGGSNGKINPKATTTRAEVAVLLCRILALDSEKTA